MLSAGTLTKAAPLPDTFSIGAWSAYWSGWIHAPNQLVRYGFWSASRPAHGELQSEVRYVSTLGSCGCASEWEVLDLTWHQSWPRPSDRSPDGLEAAKCRARGELAAWLEREA